MPVTRFSGTKKRCASCLCQSRVLANPELHNKLRIHCPAYRYGYTESIVLEFQIKKVASFSIRTALLQFSDVNFLFLFQLNPLLFG